MKQNSKISKNATVKEINDLLEMKFKPGHIVVLDGIVFEILRNDVINTMVINGAVKKEPCYAVHEFSHNILTTASRQQLESSGQLIGVSIQRLKEILPQFVEAQELIEASYMFTMNE